MRKPLLISISGTSGSGKSYLHEKLAKYTMHHIRRLGNLKVAFIREAARDILSDPKTTLDLSVYRKDNFKQLSKPLRDKYRQWQKNLCEKYYDELMSVKDCDIIITDRSSFDQLIYYDIQCGLTGSNMYRDAMSLSKKIKKQFNHQILLLDTPINYVYDNLNSDEGHHYTNDFHRLLEEKVAFLNGASKYKDLYEKIRVGFVRDLNYDYIEMLFKTIISEYHKS